METVRTLTAVLCVALVVASLPAPAVAHVNHVEADAQLSPDGTVVVESVYVAGDGYVAVQRDDDGEPGDVLGYRALERGVGFQTEVDVPVDEAAWRNWSGPTTVHLVLRTDDGDGEFDPSDDTVIQAFGRPTADAVTLAKGDRAAVSARSFSPLRPVDGAITVRYTALPTSGHLVVENVSNGRVIGSVALGAGVHHNVSVPLDGFDDREANLAVRAALYRDDGDRTFTGGETAIVTGDEPVATRFTVSPELDDNGTATPALVTTATPFSNTTTTLTPTASATATDSVATPTATEGQPGFGVVPVAVAALLCGAALALRRHER